MDSYPGALGQVLANLINNAMVHGYEGVREATSSYAPNALATTALCCRYRTLAAALRPITANHIFEPFHHPHGPGRLRPGLHISTTWSARSWGRIEFTSEVGHGTRFRATLPVHAPNVAPNGPHPPCRDDALAGPAPAGIGDTTPLPLKATMTTAHPISRFPKNWSANSTSSACAIPPTPTADRFPERIWRYGLPPVLQSGRDEVTTTAVDLHPPALLRVAVLFCACNKIITKDHSRVAEYLTYLDKEMELVAQSIGEDRCTVQLHLVAALDLFNGDELRALMATIRKYFVFTDDAELGVKSIRAPYTAIPWPCWPGWASTATASACKTSTRRATGRQPHPAATHGGRGRAGQPRQRF